MEVGVIRSREVALPDFNDREIMRYASSRMGDVCDLELFDEVKILVGQRIRPMVVYREMPISISGIKLNFGGLSVESCALAKAMHGAERVLFMGATLGIEVDRLIAKLSRISVSRAQAADAVASERIEALCNAFCREIDSDVERDGLISGFRFSPGYGDLPLEFQKDIFSVIMPQKYIGLTLNSSLMMSPSKSVSAIVALERKHEV